MKKTIILILIMALLLCSTSALASVMVVTGTPTYDDSEGMTQNLTHTIQTLNKQIIEKGKTFSLNEILGPRTEDNGYAPALNGNGVEVMGGGVSQVATTLYLALKELGEEIIYDERHTFDSAFNAGYVEDVKDTALTDYRHGLDFKFTNNTADDLVISMWDGGGTLFCQLTDASLMVETPTEEPPAAEPTPAPATVQENTYYVVNVKTAVNLREEPSTASVVLAEVPKGSAVQSTGELVDNFLRVDYDGKIGYIHSDYLEKAASTEILLTVVNCNTSVSLRETASKKAAKLADVTLGEKVRSLDHEESGFLEVVYGELRGYILKEYLEETQE